MITLTTDFGLEDPYGAAVKGVILSINPDALIVDVSHQVEPFNILQGAFLLGYCYTFFPKDAIHVAVVDPGVGTERRGILLATPQGSFIGPDNGIFSYVLRDAPGFHAPRGGPRPTQVPVPRAWRAYSLTEPRFWRHPVSSTFHGRDIFAPVAAHLSRGVKPEEMGRSVPLVTYLPVAEPRWRGSRMEGRVVHVDCFGNLITNIPGSRVIGKEVQVEVAGKRIQGISSAYLGRGELVATVGSHEHLELARPMGSAAAYLRAKVGDLVKVVRK
ncbi:MAG: SAM-dependent chlorinase/fluorinase [Chloroflexi bacterium]|nr:SAM-dependent chlorinase/fluorinase [Chloroflexota bacterium]